MKFLKSFIAGAALVASCGHARAVVDLRLELVETNLVLSWPSSGYEQYLIEYRPVLSTNVTWLELTNCYPANNANRSTYTISCCTLAQLAGTNAYFAPDLDFSNTSNMASESATELWAMPADGSGSAVPLRMYPAGFNTNSLILFERVRQNIRNAIATHSVSLESGCEITTLERISNGGCECPDMGFFRVRQIPDWAFVVTNHVYDGPTFLPVEFGDGQERVRRVEIMLDGQPSTISRYTWMYDGGQTNWGMEVDFDRIPSGSHEMQLVTTIQMNDEAGDEAAYVTMSNLTQTITVDNLVTFTNWDDLVWNNTNFTFKVQLKDLESDWNLNIYDAWGDYVTNGAGHTTTGEIEWTWDLKDAWANRRDNLEYDPFFFGVVSFNTSTASRGAIVPTNRITPTFVIPYPDQGLWLISYMSGFFDEDETSNTYMGEAIGAIQGGVDLRDVPTALLPLAYGTNGLTQEERDGDWMTLKNVLKHRLCRNFYYFGHGSQNSIGGDFSVYDEQGRISGCNFTTNSKAFVTSQTVKNEVTYNLITGRHPFRFVWLDGCSTAGGSWPEAFGINKATNEISFYTNKVNNPSMGRPSAFVGWSTKVYFGMNGWGSAQDMFYCRSQWMQQWSYNWQTRPLDQALEDGRNDSGWAPSSLFWGSLRIFGYNKLRMNEYNLKQDWPGGL